jgi:hypothetical protein
LVAPQDPYALRDLIMRQRDLVVLGQGPGFDTPAKLNLEPQAHNQMMVEMKELKGTSR